MKFVALIPAFLMSAVVNAAPTPNKSVVCTFSVKPASQIFRDQKGGDVLVNCSNSDINREITSFSNGPQKKTKAEMIEFLLSKGFEIKTDNIMVQKSQDAPKNEEVFKL